MNTQDNMKNGKTYVFCPSSFWGDIKVRQMNQGEIGVYRFLIDMSYEGGGIVTSYKSLLKHNFSMRPERIQALMNKFTDLKIVEIEGEDLILLDYKITII